MVRDLSNSDIAAPIHDGGRGVAATVVDEVVELRLQKPDPVTVGILHELGHAWLLDHADQELHAKVPDSSGRAVWADEGVAWIDRGVEYAAAVLSWGLADEAIGLERLGDPPCGQLPRL